MWWEIRFALMYWHCLLPAQRLADRHGPIRVLVIGGSQGARILNQTLPQVAALVGDEITLWHQTGKGSLPETEKAYQQVGQTQHKGDRVY
ncbi:UDP-N-acetylglucosamine--N-acetylmuramyl-(pentapeptide) pyrophosphoryl-undecaprenol N-acetylglucosamine transferase [Pantoea agglomerans]|uniref:UDP-N-acetylglucosamine--N-acetylmuramyl-(Pentapeptide) pyrophosphoryl-undecaprenol N-acetylglucosamine transferase n=1 Tax=Enterobacter agglomerans TaxID=549 RepID=A0A379AKI3_ENTAG|nr:UDP-N-acetylglucosamine--N-acetylmuramyl-(pentapeptide) pyrophosphoryl-undecaprenol N-acetylglucosamine transferase [Pantoea agglomerans]